LEGVEKTDIKAECWTVHAKLSILIMFFL